MLEVAFRRVKPEKAERLRGWLAEAERRADEVRETFRQETVRHEVAFLVEGADGPILVYAMEAEDFDRARGAFTSSTLAIDARHAEVMADVLEPGRAPAERLYEVRL